MYNEKYGLEYPMPSDIYDVEVFNSNFSKLADVSNNNSDAIAMKQNKFAYVVASSDSNDNYKNCADFVMNEYDTEGLYRVIDSLVSGAKLILCPGVYYIKESILIDKPITIEGLNHKAIITMKDDGFIFNISNTDNVTIHNIYLSKNGTDITGAELMHSTGIIKASNVVGLYIEKCGFYYRNVEPNESIKSVVQLSGNATDVIIKECVMSNCRDMLTSKCNGKKTGYVVDVNSEGNYTLAIGANFATEHSVHKNHDAKIQVIGYGNEVTVYEED